MQYELFNWERRVKDPSDRKRISQEEYNKETDNIKAAFVSVLLSSEQEVALERYVRLHQTGILHLSRELKPRDGMVAALDHLCIFLEQRAFKYLDPDLPLPFFRLGFMQGYLRENAPLVKERLQAAGVDPRLTDLVLDLLKDAQQDSRLTYRQWFPLQDLVVFVLQLPKDAQRLVEMMYCLNVNTSSTYRFMKTQVLEALEAKDFVSEKIPELGRIRRYVGWLEHRPGYQYVEGRTSLTRMLSTWLEELARLTEKEAQEAAGDEVKGDDSGFGLDSTKVITSLTVNELGLLVRLFMETGVFRTRNRKGLARFMAKNVVTLKKEAVDEVSSNHLYGTLYSINDATMDSVHAILNRMLVRLGKLRLEQRQKKPAKTKK
ncbi:hypothetical protein [Dinghuibacter silviterrae]|uniref:Uncharacterized protein n=1 Tax=Dinghuibacter silviterrae TaxID=1539049 RepID=A0A4R8DT43_9BACT|nr:hypothetical protein [Dinghuibacter silviterrae]TDX01269.1 hypothetical protein EDB95_2302 [Dinghuibacter silviterrae]